MTIAPSPSSSKRQKKTLIKAVNHLYKDDSNSNSNIEEYELVGRPNSLKEFVDIFEEEWGRNWHNFHNSASECENNEELYIKSASALIETIEKKLLKE